MLFPYSDPPRPQAKMLYRLLPVPAHWRVLTGSSVSSKPLLEQKSGGYVSIKPQPPLN